jgi:hypothetical protein
VAERDDPYFDVVRVGISDVPIRMRFGRCLWQKTDSCRAHLLRLVAEAADHEQSRRPLSWFQPELSILEGKAAAAQEGIDALLGELHAAGTLPASALSAVRGRMEQAWIKRARDFDESRNLNLHF